MGSISGLKPLHSKHAIGVFLCPRIWKRLSTESPCGLQVATGVVGHCVDPVQHRKAPAFLGDFIYPHGGRRVVGWWGGGVVGGVFGWGWFFKKGNSNHFFWEKTDQQTKIQVWEDLWRFFSRMCFFVRVAFFGVVVMLLDSCFRNKFDSKRPVDIGSKII